MSGVETELGSATAAILAGGKGTRLRASVSDRPKVLAPVRGRPYLSFLLDQLVAAGVRDVVLLTGYMAERVEQDMGTSYGPARLRYSAEDAPLGTGGAVRLALPLLGPGPLLLLNGDSYCDVDLAALWRAHRERKAQGTLTLTRVEDTSRFGRVELEESGALRRFEEKGGAEGPGWINAGIYVLGPRVLSSIDAAGEVSLEKDTLPAWIGAGLYGFPTQGRFLDIGTPRSYTEAEQFFADA